MRPEVVRSRARRRQSCRPPRSACPGSVESLLFDGANSAVLVREAQSRAEIRIALPQTGRFADLRVGETIAFGFDPQRAVCFAHTLPMPAEATVSTAARNAHRAGAAAGAGAALARRADRAAARRARRAVAARARRAARLRVEPRPVPDVLRRAAVLAHVRAHGRDVDRRHGLHAADRVPDRVVHREDRARPREVRCCSCCA